MADRSVAKPMSTQKSTNAEEMPFYIHAPNACLHSCLEFGSERTILLPKLQTTAHALHRESTDFDCCLYGIGTFI